VNDKVKILFLAANPTDTGSRLRLDREFREIGQRISRGTLRDRFELASEWAVRVGDLQEVLLRHKPVIVHFSGHGDRKKGIILEDEHGTGKAVNRQALASLFRILKDNIRVVVLNACYAKDQAMGVAETIDFTIGMNAAIGDEDAIVFAAHFYQSLANGRTVNEAFDLGVNQLGLQGMKGEKVPELIVREGADASKSVLPAQPAIPEQIGADLRASAERTVAVGGDVRKSNVIVGDGNTITTVGDTDTRSGFGIWKIAVTAVLALILSAPFIGAAIPKYKLQIKSPPFKKGGTYEASVGPVTIAWSVSKEQWFREIDLADARANVTIKRLPDGDGRRFENLPGELKTTLDAGKYEVRIQAVEHHRLEIIALEVSSGRPVPEPASLTGTVVEKEPKGRPIQGAEVTVDELQGMKPVETSSDGVFTIDSLPRGYGEKIRIRVVKEGFEPNPWTEDVVLGAAPPRVELRRAK
jgi:hypothetical protein